MLQPKFGLDLSPTSVRAPDDHAAHAAADRITTTLLVHEPRNRVIELVVDDSQALEGLLPDSASLQRAEHQLQVQPGLPYYLGDANELRERVVPRVVPEV